MILSILFLYWKNIIVITNEQQNYIMIIFLTGNTQMIESLHDSYCVNNNVQFKNNKDVVLIYSR